MLLSVRARRQAISSLSFDVPDSRSGRAEGDLVVSSNLAQGQSAWRLAQSPGEDPLGQGTAPSVAATASASLETQKEDICKD